MNHVWITKKSSTMRKKEKIAVYKLLLQKEEIERPPTGDIPPKVPGPTSGQLDFKTYNQPK